MNRSSEVKGGLASRATGRVRAPFDRNRVVGAPLAAPGAAERFGDVGRERVVVAVHLQFPVSRSERSERRETGKKRAERPFYEFLYY